MSGKLAPLHNVMRRTGLDAIAIVPGSNFLRLFGKDFHQMERPLVVIAPAKGVPVAIVPNLELLSFQSIGFDGQVFDWRDEEGYSAAFLAAGEALPELRAGSRIGVEGQRMRVFDYLALARALPGAELVDAHAEISTIRLRKTPEEIENLRRAVQLSEAALEATLAQVRIGMTETEVEGILLRELFAQGVEGLSFDPIVAAGDNSAKPHAKARRDYRIKSGDALLFDFGGRYGNLNADITRTVFVGHVSDHDRAFYDTVLAANEKWRSLAKPGLLASDLDDGVRLVLERSQFARYTRHKTGHGLGLDVHEAPQIMRGNHQALEPGMIFTIEPGLYREGEAGVRIEDNVVITERGAECLSSFPRELRIVG